MSSTLSEIALEFIHRARRGDITGAEALCTANARHHNPWFAPGMPTLLAAIAEADRDAPDGSFEPLRTIEGPDHVAIHSRVRHKPDEPGMACVHIFRFEDGRIADLWDVAQAIPPESPNTDGML